MGVLISDRVSGDIRIREAGLAAFGAWVRMLSWLSDWPEQRLVIPHSARRMLGGTPKVMAKLVEAGLLSETEAGWLALGEGDLWKFNRSSTRRRIPDWLRARVVERDKNQCQKCGATENLTLDHIIPWSLGGSNAESNLRALCRRCNCSRGNRAEVD